MQLQLGVCDVAHGLIPGCSSIACIPVWLSAFALGVNFACVDL